MLMLVDDVVVWIESLHGVVGTVDGRLGVSELDGEAVGDGDEVGRWAGRVDIDVIGGFLCHRFAWAPYRIATLESGSCFYAFHVKGISGELLSGKEVAIFDVASWKLVAACVALHGRSPTKISQMHKAHFPNSSLYVLVRFA